MVWYCHQCQSRIEIAHDLKCPECSGEFVEELPSSHEEEDPGPSTNSGANPRIIIVNGRASEMNNPFRAFESLFGGNSPFNFGGPNININRTHFASPGATSDTSQVEGEGPPQVATIVDFFNQLIGNLAEGSPQIHLNISNIGDYAADGNIDNIVTHLLNQFENSGQTETLTPEDIAKLPMTTVNEKQVENGTQCATCMETFILNENVGCLDCQHIFHRPCIEPWLRKHNTCPICRKVVDAKKWSPKPTFTDIDELD